MIFTPFEILFALNESELRELKGFGSKALDEVKEKVGGIGAIDMHRHGYKGRKFHRETDHARALLKVWLIR